MKRRYDLPPLDPLQRYTVDEALDYLRISRAKFFQDVRREHIRVIHEGARTFVPGREIERLSATPPLSAPSPAPRAVNHARGKSKAAVARDAIAPDDG